MTVKKLNAANELMARIEKAKECKRLLEGENSTISITDGSSSVAVNDKDIKAALIGSVSSLLDKLEDEFKWFDLYWNDDEQKENGNDD